MKILFLAPHPFFQERGTPIAVDLLLRALAGRGETVDVLTYPEGTTPVYGGGVTIRRISGLSLLSGIRPGFSIKKVLCDLAMRRQAMRLARANSYDLVHAVEESVFMAMRIKKRLGIPYIYDMDSSLPRQLVEKLTWLRPMLGPLRCLEARAIKQALAVVPMCAALARMAEAAGATKTFVLNDVPLASGPVPDSGDELRREFAIHGLCFMYIGNLEKYQGIDLLLAAFDLAAQKNQQLCLVVAGGTPRTIRRYAKKAARLDSGSRVRFVGAQPVARMAQWFAAADVLVSPRVQGNNTPMKIYSYLDAGKALLATRIESHTQVLDGSVAMLVAPEPAGVAAGMLALAADPALRRELSQAARELVAAKYSFAVFNKTCNSLYDWVARQLGRQGISP